MNCYAMFFVAVAFVPACIGGSDESAPELTPAISLCGDKLKVDRCHKDASYEAAYCYGENEIGPQPFLSGGDHPYFDCAAPEEYNQIGPGPFYFRNYWCCGSRGCLPGTEIPCNCGLGAQGFAYCSGNGLNVGACICPEVSPRSSTSDP